ncbi:hypothetical protein BC937DRAFT_90326 [Endogone sp. FLAS-F59071]|nr:hypothetical protein BC937DRAFT_90326 [Endogone sp. FLAS-F59071]|eukprot:RUS17158.1 hypothetical protein BC937DRAFT_90326 [Endogone sp. FLAS-F59071]
MRVVTKAEQEEASAYAMKGFAIGALKWAAVGLCLSGLMQVYVPWYRATRLPNKFYIVMAFGLGGGAHSSDRYLVQYERRGRKEQLAQTRRERWEALYAKPTDENKIASNTEAAVSQ